jgi:iron(III) transport system substrate-binding protein
MNTKIFRKFLDCRCTLLSILCLMLFFASHVRAAEVVVYCALDQPYAEPIIKSFEHETGIRVKTVYDSEAVKTAGLVNRILTEQKRPQCDVFWNNEKLRIVVLAQRNALESYRSPRWKERNLPHDEKNELWSEFSARLRVIVYSTAPEMIKKWKLPLKSSSSELQWLLDPKYKGMIAIAHPLFGTTSTQFLDWIQQERRANLKPESWLQKVIDQKPILCNGNSDVVRRVAAGQAAFGFTDSDDVLAAKSHGDPVDFLIPNSEPLLIPNTIALIRSAPHRKEAEAFIDYVLSEKTEIALAQGISKQIPLGTVSDTTTMPSLPFFSGPDGYRKTRRAHEEELVKTLESDLNLLRNAFQQ